ncbi:HAMP domain-containing protein [Nocardioides sp. ChNu-153]|nr:HAMP domain-containing protein [Nocardioides sp. ChNu-99]MDN7121206.1 HAMP domain-containing protein [Nocardioides sp. ChNu-153]
MSAPATPPPAVPPVRRRAGVRARTTAAATLVVALAFAVGAVALVLALGASLRGAAGDTAENRAEELAAALEQGGVAALPSDDPDGGDDEQDVDDIAWQVTRGSTLVASSGTGGLTLPRADGTTRLDGDRYVVRTDDVEVGTGDDEQEHVVAVAVTLEDAEDSVAALWPLLATGIPVAVLLVGVTTWLVTGRALRPVERIRAEVATIGSGALERRVPVPPSGDEVARLATTMNAMLERLETAAHRQRAFVSDTSHELRSPLASLRQTAEVARAHPGALDEGELVTAVLEETTRLQHLVEQMLVLTRTEEGAATRRRTEVDLDDLLLTEVARLRRNRPDLRVDGAGVTPLRTTGDGPALGQVVRNLVDNAARHATGTVALSVASFAWWRGFCSAPWRSCCRDHAGLAAGRCRGLNREGCARSGPFGSLPLHQSPKAPPLTRITMPRPMRTMGKRMCSQRSSTSAIGGRVATNFARATRTATSARKTMQ